ncbi:MAG TPA: molybdopterin-dependent oxidoreductase [Anaerolineales bacterium]|nr:molybdopterin-dependent oxidoreductase [Anaerolineales bacterium]
MPIPVPPLTRREVLKLLSLGAGAWIFASCSPAPADSPTATATAPDHTPTPEAEQPDLVQPTSPPEPTAESFPVGMPQLPDDFAAGRITPIDRFYEQSYAGFPQLDTFDWRVNLNGLFDNPMDLGLFDLKRRPNTKVMRTLECIGNPVGGTLIGNATWTGISLRALLEEAGIQPEAAYLQLLAADDYETTVRTELAMDERSLIVFEMNGEPLPIKHGFPARLMLPGVYGQKQPKWVISIRASETDRLGTWENKGWSNAATVQINSKIETPRLRQYIPAHQPFQISGFAFSDSSGVTDVDVSIDGGETWMQAEPLRGPDEGVWTLWYWTWEDPLPGKHIVVARASDGNGVIQVESGTFGVLNNVFPNGTSLMHNLSVEVVP